MLSGGIHVFPMPDEITATCISLSHYRIITLSN